MIALYRRPLPLTIRYILGLFLLILGSVGFVYYYVETQTIAKQFEAKNSVVTTPSPVIASSSPSSTPQASITPQSQKIKLSTATQSELESLPSIGEVKAKAIIEYRSKYGFKSVNDLQKIKGIGPKTMEKLRPLVEL